MPEAIVTERLTKRHGALVAVNHLDMAVPTGQVTGFVGPNGAGKTTTIRMLLGLIRPTSGAAWVLGEPLTSAAAYLQRVGSLVDGPAFYPALSARKNLLVLARLAETVDRIEYVLDATGLRGRADDPVATYSMGMRQRLAIAAAMLPNPELLILDEPANGLDPAGIREIRKLLRALADQDITVFVSSHQLSELEQVSDRVVLLRTGELVYQGALTDLLAGQSAQTTARPEEAGDVGALAGIIERHGWTVRAEDNQVIISAPADAAGTLNRLAHQHGITLAELHTRPPTLEEIFFDLTEGEGGA
ncbi:ABC transporter ATP-binding protein [Phytoactinopolyspora mesophila]|uniref:ATP-binding cassette domain-containing protein n=1 Tax=Phytoactinopolyspora mesophila TaxID=2650750 RepID=A0A7K3M1D7_9ACTN|nr:ABC transporter ATP-binding protein [Phytoactinopolyspora mesophila]NDL57111.1 ATP-binding cassette domain-containing protein [Phytoactinopolyspora mesophila]